MATITTAAGTEYVVRHSPSAVFRWAVLVPQRSGGPYMVECWCRTQEAAHAVGTDTDPDYMIGLLARELAHAMSYHPGII